MPIISVSVPVYNVEPYLRQCVDSILAQTFTDFELILVDDGSPDNCGAICDEYAEKDRRIHVIHQANGGLSAARNAGLDWMFANSTSRYVTFIDSDDMVDENYLEKLLAALEENDADISVCDMLSFCNDEDVLKMAGNDNVSTAMSGREACLSIYRMDGKVPVMAWGKIYKTNLFKDIRYPVGMVHEDDATTPELFYKSKTVILTNDILYFYRQREGSITNKLFTAARFDGVKAVERCIAFFEQQNDRELSELARINRLVVQSKIVIRAYGDHAQKAVPKEYAMPERKALRNIRKWTSDDTYTWYLSLVHPKWVKSHSYIQKIRSLLRLKDRRRQI